MKRNPLTLSVAIQSEYRKLDEVKNEIRLKTIQKSVIQKNIDQSVHDLTRGLILSKANKENKKTRKNKRKSSKVFPKRKYIGTYNATTHKYE